MSHTKSLCLLLLLTLVNRSASGQPVDLIRPVSSTGSSSTITGIATRSLVDKGVKELSVDVFNFGEDTVTFSFTADTLDSPFHLSQETIDQSIGGSERIEDAVISRIDTDGALSGVFTHTFTLSSPGDDDNEVTVTYFLYDSAILTSNAATIDVDATGGMVQISNLAEESHAGARRDSAKIANAFAGGGFDVTGLVGEVIPAGDSVQGTATVDRLGVLSGVRQALLRIFYSNQNPDSGQNDGFTSDSPFRLNLTGTVPIVPNDSATVAIGEKFADLGIGTNSAETASIFLGDFTAATGGNVTLDAIPYVSVFNNFVAYGDVVKIETPNTDDRFAIQFKYDALGIPNDVNEEDLTFCTVDETTGELERSIHENSDGGAAATFFNGSYSSYLAFLGGGEPNLGAVGVDPSNDNVWGVFDYQDHPFVVCADANPLAADFNNDGIVNISDLTILLSHFGERTGATKSQGDADGDGDIDSADMLLVQRLYGSVSGSSLTAAGVPEPGTLTLSLLSLLSFRRRCLTIRS